MAKYLGAKALLCVTKPNETLDQLRAQLRENIFMHGSFEELPWGITDGKWFLLC
jgi:hypothetical protein